MHMLTAYVEKICALEYSVATKGQKKHALSVLTALSEINAHECIPENVYRECYKLLKQYDAKIENIPVAKKTATTKKTAIKTVAKKTSAKKRAPTRRKS